ncbi:acyl-CoA thioesterase [Gordonia sp. NPDC003424]
MVTDSPDDRRDDLPHHIERVRVEYADSDMGGYAHASNALLWAERAEHALLRTLGLEPTFPRRRVEIDYPAPAAHGDAIDVWIDISAAGTTSVTFTWAGVCGRTTCFAGRTVAVMAVNGEPASVASALSEFFGEKQRRT